jgi:hypothetical protein
MNRETLLMLARQVSPFNAQKYLLAKGWKLVVKNPREDILLFHRRNNKSKQVIIPSCHDYTLYPDDLLQLAISRLEQEEKRDALSILGQMITPDADILRYRIQSPKAESGALSLSSVQMLISSVIASLSAAVCDVFSPDKKIPLHHKRLQTKHVRSLLDRSQFGQTEHGSFIIKVIAPLDGLDGGASSFTEMSDGGTRYGIEHLLKSVESVVHTVKKGHTARFIKQGIDKPPFSDNLINSIVDMQLWSDADIEISSEWAPVLPAAKSVPSKVFIPSDYFGDIKRIGQGFAPTISENPIEFFSGFVIELCGETNDEEQKFGDVVIQLTRSDGESFPATVFFVFLQHQDAIRSYEQNRPVYLSGKLIREGGRKRRIRELDFFKLCEDEQE